MYSNYSVNSETKQKKKKRINININSKYLKRNVVIFFNTFFKYFSAILQSIFTVILLQHSALITTVIRVRTAMTGTIKIRRKKKSYI